MTDHCPIEKIVDSEKANSPNTQIHDRSLLLDKIVDREKAIAPINKYMTDHCPINKILDREKGR